MPQILGPTRINQNQKLSLIDNIFINFNDLHCTSDNLLEKVRANLPKFLIVEKLEIKNNYKTKRKKRDYRNFDKDNFLNDLENLKLNEAINNTNNINGKYELLHTKFMETIDKNAPLKILSNKEIKRKNKPWITKGILTSIKEKNRLLKIFLKAKNNFFYERYKFYRDKINHLIRISKKKHYNKKFSQNINNIKSITTHVSFSNIRIL